MIPKSLVVWSAALTCALTVSCLAAGEVKLDFTRYYDGPAVVEALKSLHRAHPKLTRLQSLGKSEEGRDIWALTIHNPKTGKDTEKPGIYLDGAIHGNEIQATEVCLYLAWYLLDGYGKNPKLRELTDRVAFYIVPVVNVDSRARFFADPSGFNIGRTARVPHDDDRDGLTDEDGYEDLDGDGQILDMRIKTPFGPYRTHPEEPRAMIRVKPGEKGEWRILGLEGRDDDGDGKLNEDPPGYLDMNRNYGFRWQPRYVQSGAGDFPMSARVTEAVSRFVMTKPNICFGVAFHNYGGMILRGPGSKLAGMYPPGDIKVLDYLGKEGEKILPGYRYLVTKDDLYTTHGDFDEWLYSNLGIFAFTPELFMPSRESYQAPGKKQQGKKGEKEDEYDFFGNRVPDDEKMKFDDNVTHGTMFSPWKKFKHPQFGEVEIGGFGTFTTRMPPPFLLPELVHRNSALVLLLARQAPEVKLELLSVDKLAADLHRVRVRATNTGAIPTLSRKAHRHDLVRKDIFRFEGAGLTVVSGGVVRDDKLHQVDHAEHRPWMVFTGVPSFGTRVVQFVVKGRGRGKVTFDSVKARNRSLQVKL